MFRGEDVNLVPVITRKTNIKLGVVGGFTRLIMKTKYVCHGLIALLKMNIQCLIFCYETFKEIVWQFQKTSNINCMIPVQTSRTMKYTRQNSRFTPHQKVDGSKRCMF